jgi:hypothetical protein
MNTGDLQPALQATLLNPDGTPANLTGATVVFTMSQRGVTLFSGAAIIVNASSGVVEYVWQPGNTNYYGSCKGVFTVTFANGMTQTFPVGADLNIVFPEAYPQFTTLDEVVTHLNITGPDNNDNFTVFGLTVSADTVQAHVDHANKYIYSLVPSLQQTTDPRWPNAELAALDLACLGVLVTSVGGAMVGAYDYFLGDMRVARAGPYTSAIKTAIAGYRASAIRNLQNVTTVAVAAEAQAAHEVPKYEGGLVSP